MTDPGEERAVLFYILQLGQDSALLRDEHFTDRRNRAIFRKIRAAQAVGRRLELVDLAIERPEDVEPGYIGALGDGVIIGGKVEAYFKAYVNALIRRAKEAEIQAIAMSPDPIPALRDALAEFQLEEGQRIAELNLPAAAPGFRGFIEKKRGSAFWGHEIKSLPVLTRALNGLRSIVVLAARPKLGKSTLALQIASDVADLGAGVLYYDMENTAYNLMGRAICRRAGISFPKFYDPDQAPFVEAGVKDLETFPNFAIINDRRLTADKIRGHLRQLSRSTERGDHLVIIDSLQKLPMVNLSERRAAVDLWLRDFEALMSDFPGLTIFLISELSREGGRPKESGDIEYTGHFLLILKSEALEKAEKEGRAWSDNGARQLYLEAARDVPLPGAPINLTADFTHWAFNEEAGF